MVVLKYKKKHGEWVKVGVAAKGEEGKAATVAVGSVVSVEPEVSAEVVNEGTENAAVFSFKIPKGNRGKAATVRVGTVITGEPGAEAEVTNSGTDTDAIFNFVIPRGESGGSSGGSTIASAVSIQDSKGEFTAQNVEDALSELKDETKYAMEQAYSGYFIADTTRYALYQCEDINMSQDGRTISLKKARYINPDDKSLVTADVVYDEIQMTIGNIAQLLSEI